MHLHIVAFNVPWPPNYGGVIDVFFRIKALADAGVRIHLHCFLYGRQPSQQLDDLCEEVCYYQRDMSLFRQFSSRPFIVSSRASQPLLRRLALDDYPILLEGLHCCYPLLRLDASNRTLIVRAHNVEHDYYHHLAHAERNLFHRSFFAVEAARLRHFEPVLLRASAVLAVTASDQAHFRALGCHNVSLIPTFHGCSFSTDHDLPSPPVLSSCPDVPNAPFALYHGNLSVPENVVAVRWLVNNVFSMVDVPFVIAGCNPTDVVRSLVAPFPNIRLIASPSDPLMNALVSQAHVIVLVTNQPTGIKLKLLRSLYQGRHCLVNSTMLAGTDLHPLCSVADTPDDMRQSLLHLYTQPFSPADRDSRRTLLDSLYSDSRNAARLIAILQQLSH